MDACGPCSAWGDNYFVVDGECKIPDNIEDCYYISSHGNWEFIDGKCIPGGELNSENIRQIRLININRVLSLIDSLPDNVFKSTDNREKKLLKDMLQSEINDAVKYAKTDDVNGMLEILKEIKSKADGSIGNNAEDDLIVDTDSQRQLLKELDNVIAAYET